MPYLQFRAGDRVRTVAAPHRTGTVIRVTRTGPYGHVTVALDGWHYADFPASALELT